MLIRAAVTRAKSAPFALETLEIDEPRPDEILVQVHAVGMCHTDLIARDLYYPMPLPIVLGHEGAGVVTKVGDQVTKVSPGDHVVLSYRSCGSCRSCLMASPGYCERIRDLTYQGTRLDGSTALRKDGQRLHSHFFGQSSFATYALSSENNTIKVPDDVPLELVAPLGCGVMTGVGAVLSSLRPPPGSSLAVYGTGSVGLSAVMAACLAGCHPIIAVDLRQTRRDLALQLGASHAVDPQTDRVTEAVREITSGGVDVALDTTGSSTIIRGAVDGLAPRGTCGLIAGTPQGTQLEADMNHILFGGRRICGIIGGDVVPDIMIPKMIEFWRAGMLPFDRLITSYSLSDINKAAADSDSGLVVKAVLLPT